MTDTNHPARERAPFDLPAALKESGMTAFVVLMLTLIIVGVHTQDAPGGLKVGFRPQDIVYAIVLAFLGRFGLALLRDERPTPVLVIGGGLFALFLYQLLTAPLAQAPLADPLEGELDLLPFESAILGWMIVTFIAGLLVRGALLLLRGRDRPQTEAQAHAATDRIRRVMALVGPVLFAFAVVYPFLPFVDRQYLDIGILVLTYVMLGWGLNIVVGLAGLLDLGYVAFYAVGAYSYALLSTHFDLSFWICMPFAGLMAASAGVILGFPVLRLRGDYLAIVTLGFGEIVRVVLLNWYEFTGGPDGVSGIDRPSFFGLDMGRPRGEDPVTFHTVFGLDYSSIDKFIFLYYLIFILAMITSLFTLRVRRLPIGRAWEALREDEIACRSLGINPTNTKLTAFGIGAMFAGFAGSFFATRQTFISPESFTFIESAVILAIVVLGGLGSQMGVVFASIVLIALPEIFRELQEFRMLFFGGAMVLIMLWRPEGLLATRNPTVLLKQARRGKDA